MNRRVAILLTQPDPVAAASSMALKIDVASEMIDRAAGTARLRWSAAYPFQDAEYRLAADQAVAYQADPLTGTFGALQADVDAGTIDPRTGLAVADLASAADLVLFKRGLYETALETIRTLRLGGKSTVKTKTTEANIRVAMQINWPAP